MASDYLELETRLGSLQGSITSELQSHFSRLVTLFIFYFKEQFKKILVEVLTGEFIPSTNQAGSMFRGGDGGWGACIFSDFMSSLVSSTVTLE